MLKILKFNVSVQTTKHFAVRFIEAAGFELNDMKTCCMINYLIELSLVDYGMLRFPGSVIAASALSLVLQTWPISLRTHTQYTEADLQCCNDQFYQLLRTAEHRSTNWRAVQVKYSTNQFHKVSLESWRVSTVPP